MDNKLREVRVCKRITQYRLANASGVNPSKISLIENGLVQPRLHEIARLAQGLNVKPSDIFPHAGRYIEKAMEERGKEIGDEAK